MNTTTLKEEILLKYRSDNNFVWTIKIVVEDTQAGCSNIKTFCSIAINA